MAAVYSAITFPPACLQPQPTGDLVCSAATSNTAIPNHSAHLLTLPSEILLTIINNLTVTSRVHLALTCKHTAILLSITPGILSFNICTPSTDVARLLREDEAFQCWTVKRDRWYRIIYYRRGAPFSQPEIRHQDEQQYCIECRYCGLPFEHPSRARHMYDLGYEGYEKELQKFNQHLFQHTRSHICRGWNGKAFSRGMFDLMDVFIGELVKEQNLEWMKAAVVSWVVSRNTKLGYS